MKILKKSLALLTPREHKQGLMVLLLVMGMALLETVGVASLMPFLAVLGNPEMLTTNPVLAGLHNHLKPLGVVTPDDFLIALGLGAFVLIIFSAGYRALTHYAMNRYIEMRRHTIGSRLLGTYLRRPYAFFLDRHSGDMSKAILSEVDQFVGSVLRPAYSMVAYTLVLIAITTLLLLVNPSLALLAAGLLGGIYALVFINLKNKLTRLGATLVSVNKGRFMAVTEAFGGIKDIKLLGREQSYLSRFEVYSKEFATTIASHQTIEQIPSFLIEALVFGTVVLLTVILTMSSGGLGDQTLGKVLPILGLYAFSAYRMKPAVQSIYQGFASLRYGEAALNSLYSDLQPGNAPEQLPISSIVPLKAKHMIALRHVSYTYPQAPKPSLIDLNLDIPVGSAVGLVGSTGAGKTTLVDLVLGLLRPTDGGITVDGVQVTDAQLRSWQQSLGYVPQEIFLTDSSIAENIALGIPKAEINHAQVERCTRLAQMHDFIMTNLPMGYDTLVGERGVRLSGGQRQRIGIARALYHNPELLVLDEATSALDTVTEQAVMDAIDALAGKKTIILVAHRLSTVKKCDQIVLLEQGKLRAIGTYDQLIASNPQFASMVRTLG
jgi:ATP-binding cassette, subfamily B, bacterial PglK